MSEPLTTEREITDTRPWPLLKELYRRFNEDQCGSWAAALSFFALLSFVPLIICGIAALGLFLQDAHEAAVKVFDALKAILPGENAGVTAKKIVADAKIEEQAAALMRFSGRATLIGIVSLLWSASRIFVNAAPPMNAAFRAPETRGFLKMQMYSLGLLLGAGVLGLLSLLPTSGPDLMRQIPFLRGLPDPSPFWLDFVFLFLSVTINAAMYTLIYRFLPSPAANVSWRQAAFGGTVIAILWEITKQGFALYLRSFGGADSYEKLYGSLGGIIILVFWVYYSSMLLLLGAEIAELYADIRKARARMPADNGN